MSSLHVMGLFGKGGISIPPLSPHPSEVRLASGFLSRNAAHPFNRLAGKRSRTRGCFALGARNFLPGRTHTRRVLDVVEACQRSVKARTTAVEVAIFA